MTSRIAAFIAGVSLAFLAVGAAALGLLRKRPW